MFNGIVSKREGNNREESESERERRPMEKKIRVTSGLMGCTVYEFGSFFFPFVTTMRSREKKNGSTIFQKYIFLYSFGCWSFFYGNRFQHFLFTFNTCHFLLCGFFCLDHKNAQHTFLLTQLENFSTNNRKRFFIVFIHKISLSLC